MTYVRLEYHIDLYALGTDYATLPPEPGDTLATPSNSPPCVTCCSLQSHFQNLPMPARWEGNEEVRTRDTMTMTGPSTRHQTRPPWASQKVVDLACVGLSCDMSVLSSDAILRGLARWVDRYPKQPQFRLALKKQTWSVDASNQSPSITPLDWPPSCVPFPAASRSSGEARDQSFLLPRDVT